MCCRWTRRPTPLPASTSRNAAGPAASRASSTSSTPGRPRASHPRSRVGGRRMRNSSTSSFRTPCAARVKTSSAPGSSRQRYGRIWNTVRCRGRAPASPDSSSTPTARRCRSRKAMWSPRPRCSTSTDRMRCATGQLRADWAPTPRSTRKTRNRSRSGDDWRSRSSTPRSSCTASLTCPERSRPRSTSTCSPSSAVWSPSPPGLSTISTMPEHSR